MRCMSSDGATDKPRPARPGRSDDRGLASIALGVLLILAVVATVVMVFSDNPVWMRVGTLAALWAAFIGAFLVARYRRQAAAEAARVRDLHTVYELQLEREISARREHELVVEKELRDTVRTETADSILALRHEIAALREQLGALGVTLPEDRFAVGGLAPAGELGAGSMQSVPSERVEPRRRAPETAGWPDPTAARAYTSSSSASSSAPHPTPAPAASSTSDPEPTSAPLSGFGAPAAPAASGTSGATFSGVGPNATPSTERTEKFSPVTGQRRRTETPADEASGPAVRPTGDAGTSSRRSAETVAPSSEPAAWTQAPAAPQTAAASPTPAPAPAPAPTPTPESAAPAARPAAAERSQATTADPAPATPTAPPSRHGDGSGLSVAELMARLGGDDAPSGGRRRRRAED